MYVYVCFEPVFFFNTGQTPSITIADLKVVYRASFKAHKKWQNILLELEVSSDDIQYLPVCAHFEWGYPDNTLMYYREGLRKWLEGGERSWGDLVEALSSPTVGRSDIAKEIERDYIQSTGSGGVTSEKQKSRLSTGLMKCICTFLNIGFRAPSLSSSKHSTIFILICDIEKESLINSGICEHYLKWCFRM